MSVEFRLQRAFSSWKTLPGPGEPAYAYFGRLVGEEGLVSVRGYANSIGITCTSVFKPEISRHVFNLPLRPEAMESLTRWTPRRSGRFYHVSDVRFRVSQIRHARRRFCRGCLGESQSHRVWWDIVSFKTCPFHGHELEDNYGHGSLLRWRWPHYGHAPNGESLIARWPENKDEDRYEHYLLQRMNVVSGPRRPLLDDVEPYQVVELCGLIGRFFSSPWLSRAPAISEDFQLGFEMLKGTHEDLVGHFERWLQDNAADALQAGIENGFGWIRRGGRATHLLQKTWKRVDLAQKEAFARCGRVTQFRELRDFNFRYVTIKRMQKMLRISYFGARPFLQAKGLETHDLKYSQAEIDEIRAAIDRLLSHAECAKMLGCSWKHIRFLVNSGYLTGYHGLTQNSEFKVELDSVAALQDRLKKLETEPNRGTRLTVWNYARRTGITELNLMDMILKGEIRPAAIRTERVGFQALRMAYLLPAAAVRSRAKDGEMTIGKARALIGLDHRSMAPLAEAGVFEIIRRSSSVCLVTERSVQAFRERYVMAPKYLKGVKGMGQSKAAVLSKLGVPRHFVGVVYETDHVVERSRLFKALGIAEADNELREKWLAFSQLAERHCPAFLLPAEITAHEQTIFNSTRVTRFTARIAAGRIVLQKKFNRRAAREWGWFERNRAETIRTLQGFKFEELPSSGLTGVCYLDDHASMERVARSLGEYHWLLLKRDIR